MRKYQLPSQQFLKETFIYNPENGECLWLHRPIHHFKNKKAQNISNSKIPNTKAGIINGGKITIRLLKQQYELSYLIIKQQLNIEDCIIVHKDGNRMNYCWDNLDIITDIIPYINISHGHMHSAEYLHECFDYDEESGKISWKYRPYYHFKTIGEWYQWNSSWSYKIAGTKNKEKHKLLILLNRKTYNASDILVRMLYDLENTYVEFLDGDRFNYALTNIQVYNLNANASNNITIGNRNRNTGSYYLDRILVLPSYEYLHECFDYDKDTGILKWKFRPLSHFKNIKDFRTFNNLYGNKFAGNIKPSGYIRVVLDNINYAASRIIWKMVTGNDPEVFIDHKNGNKSDNSWDNLREATAHENSCNRKVNHNKTIPIKGIYQDSNGNFYAEIHSKNERHYLGRFNTVEDAKNAYDKAAQNLHKDFFNDGSEN